MQSGRRSFLRGVAIIQIVEGDRVGLTVETRFRGYFEALARLEIPNEMDGMPVFTERDPAERALRLRGSLKQNATFFYHSDEGAYRPLHHPFATTAGGSGIRHHSAGMGAWRQRIQPSLAKNLDAHRLGRHARSRYQRAVVQSQHRRYPQLAPSIADGHDRPLRPRCTELEH